MANTYKDDARRGLSKLQKAILVWLLEQHNSMRERGQNPHEYDFWAGAGTFWAKRRKTFYGRPVNLFGTTKHQRYGNAPRYWRNEAQAVSRALRRLEERGLVIRWIGWTGYTSRAELTEAGESVAAELREDGTTTDYLDKRRDALELLYSLARPRCSVCGGLTSREGHCKTADCINNGE